MSKETEMKPILIPLALAATLGACSDWGTDAQPVLDGAPSAAFHNDLSACRQLARSQTQLDRETMAQAAIGAGIGGVLGELDEDGEPLGGAIAGALVGSAAGASEAADARAAIVETCLRGRGHPVVG
jgi:uncharacterized protein YcfJ